MKIISGNREFRPSAADILAMATNQNFVDLNTFRQTVASLEREKEFWQSKLSTALITNYQKTDKIKI
ncbi:hypothetical protein MASR1M12_28950 [Erysipelotrichia bacterium]